MPSDDEDELAEIRAARNQARSGVQGNLAALREQQRRAQEEASRASSFFENDGRSDGRQRQGPDIAGQPQPGASGRAGSEDEDEEQEDEEHRGGAEGEAGEDEEMLMHEGMRQFFPISFGQQEKKVIALDQVHAKHKRQDPAFGPPRPPKPGGPSVGPPRPPTQQQQQGDAGAGGDDEEGPGVGPPRPPPGSEDGGDGPSEAGEDGDAVDEEEEEEEDPYHLPISHEVVLGSSHIKAVTCMDIDHTGSRLITGSLDYTIRMYDFNGMKRDMKAFREFEPQEAHPVLSVSWSPTGESYLVVTGAAKAQIRDRDGLNQGEFKMGDMYIRDPRNTKGHISALTSGQWHPTDRWTVMTGSEDGTIRIWDTHNLLQKTVVKPTTAKPVRTAVTALSYGLEGKLIGAGLVDGCIQLWNVQGKFGTSAAVGQVLPPAPQMVEKQGWSYVSKANQVVKGAHIAQTEISCLTFSQDGNTLLSRGMDETLKVWDLRKFKDPVKVWDGLPCAYATTKAIFSPDEQVIVTGVSAGGRDEGGALVFFDKTKLELVRKVGVPGTATALCWHHRLNQIFVGIGNRKSGQTRVLYDTTFSERGVMVGAAKALRMASPFDFQPQEYIREPRLTGKKRRQKEAEDAARSKRPDPGMAGGKGKQGRIGTTGGTLLTQHLLKQKGKLIAPENIDPREAILRHADKKDIFSTFTAAYAATQPKPIYAQSDDEEEDEGEEGGKA